LTNVSELTASGAHTACMRALSRRAFIATGLGAALAPVAGSAIADPDDDEGAHRHHHDHDRARIAVERGEARPLSEILAKVRPELGGEMAGVEFRRQSGRWVYEFRVLTPTGQMTEVYVDAATADILKREAH
jgi:uncharacterized membrane protein YkoI